MFKHFLAGLQRVCYCQTRMKSVRVSKVGKGGSDDRTSVSDEGALAESGLKVVASDPFLSEAASILGAMRRTTARVLAACGGAERPVDVAERLGIDRSLAWKMWQVSRGTGAFPSPAHIPGELAVKRFLQAASKHGVPDPMVTQSRNAFEDFQRLITRHAGNRAAVDALLSSFSEEGRTRLETAMRRDGFRANAYLLGVQARAMYQLDAMVNAGDHFMPEVYRVRALVGLRRNRLGVPWIVGRTSLVHAEGPSSEVIREPLGVATESGSAFVLREFCSTPEPDIRRRIIAGVTAEDELQPGRMGQAGAVTVVTGERLHGMPRQPVQSDAVTMAMMTPCERACYDVIAPESLIAGRVRLRVHSTVQVDVPYLRGEEYASIPASEDFEDLGPVADAPEAPEIPRQGEILEWLTARLRVGPDAGRYRLWRVRLRYPPVPSVLAARYAFRQLSAK
jgi:hypothetical protein